MVIAHDFFYEKVLSLSQALKLKNEHQEKAQILAGGTDLIVALKETSLSPALLIDLKGLESLSLISEDESTVRIGCNVTFSEIIASSIMAKECPIVVESAHKVASKGVRNRATIVGNLCSAVPCMDSAPPLLALGAKVVIQSVQGEHRISLVDFLQAPRRVALAPNELVIGLEIPKIKQKNASIFLKLGRYQGEDLAQANLAIVRILGEYRIVYGSLSAVPVRAEAIETFLTGKTLTSDVLKQAKSLVSQIISPITDVRASKEYRLHMAQVMLERGLLAVEDRMNGRKVDSSTLLGG